MAFENHRWAWSVVGLRGTTYNVLHCLAESANGMGIVDRLSTNFISRRCNISREWARQCLQNLEESQLIKIVPRTSVTGQQISNGYILNRSRYFPANVEGNEEQNGQVIGAMMWSTMRMILQGSLSPLSPDEKDLIDNQFREAFFDMSERSTRMDQRRGRLYLFAETDTKAVQIFKKKCLKLFLRKKEEFPPYLIDYIEPMRPLYFNEECEQDTNPEEW